MDILTVLFYLVSSVIIFSSISMVIVNNTVHAALLLVLIFFNSAILWLMLQAEEPDDYVISTGESHSIREFLDIAFEHIGISDWSSYIKQDPKFMRPSEVDHLIGDASKAYEKLGWKPKTSFKQLVWKMVDNDIALLKK